MNDPDEVDFDCFFEKDRMGIAVDELDEVSTSSHRRAQMQPSSADESEFPFGLVRLQGF